MYALRIANPAKAWDVFVQLAQPFIVSLSVRGLESRASQATVHFPPWAVLADDSLVTNVLGPSMLRLATRQPFMILRLCWDLFRDVVPYSPPHVQTPLLACFGALPWNELSAVDAQFVSGLGLAYTNAGFQTPQLLAALCALVSRLPLFHGTISFPRAEAAAIASLGWASLANLLLAVDDVETTPLAPMLRAGLHHAWDALDLQAYSAVLDQMAEWLRAASELEVMRVDRKVQIALALSLVENLAVGEAEKEAALLQCIVRRLLPCAVIPRPLLHGMVRHVVALALRRAHAGDSQLLRSSFLLYNHPEYSYSPGIEAALDSGLGGEFKVSPFELFGHFSPRAF
jgi:hypothetical protein